MDEGASPGSAFHVTLDNNDDLVWTAENNGKTVQFDTDPKTDLWQRWIFSLIGILPTQDLL